MSTRRAILCVDDERIILTSLRAQLRRRFPDDLEIETAEDGTEGLEVLEELIADGVEVPLVISDQLMPGMRGEEFLAEVHRRLPDTLTVLLTGQATAEAVGQAVNTARLYRFIGKPWTEDDLAMTVREALRAWNQTHQIRLRDAELQQAHKASLRFVPREFLGLLGREKLVDVRYGDHVEREMHILFADMRGFTALVEGKGPAESFAFINDYMQLLDRSIRDHHGFISNIEGDAVLGLFGGTADQAVRAGVEAHRELSAWNTRRATTGEAPIHMGVGVNSGPLLLGTIGGEDRLQCDVVGDAVNLGSRVESLTKVYQTEMLITDTTERQLTEPWLLRRVDRVRAKGKTHAVTLYEVLDALDDERREARRRTADAYAQAREAYERGDIAAATVGFATVVADDPTDGAAWLHTDRCARLAGTELPEDWDGTTRMHRK
ncbi:MAG: adenylate/guanylate cyclase domain-containing response regulator [Deltaproteobacteria bacterium]|nr:MAG: adenylate/guanylate cyclase domain-containing response regulator [Deltaproteobacteria bacterium]